MVLALRCYNYKDCNSLLGNLPNCICPCCLTDNTHEKFVFAVSCYGLQCLLADFIYKLYMQFGGTYEFAVQAALSMSLCRY